MLLQHYIFDTLLLNFAIFLIIIKIVLFLSINIFIIGRYGSVWHQIAHLKKVTRRNGKTRQTMSLYANRSVANTLDYRISMMVRPIELLIGLIDSLDLFYPE